MKKVQEACQAEAKIINELKKETSGAPPEQPIKVIGTCAGVRMGSA